MKSKLSQTQLNRVFNSQSVFNFTEDDKGKFKSFAIGDDKVDIDKENGYVYLNDELVDKDNVQVPEKIAKLLLRVIPKIVVKKDKEENKE